MNVIKRYFRDISKFPLLTPEEEKQLGKAAQTGNRKARDKLINSNLRLVIDIAKRYSSQGILLEDLIQEGNDGLIIAAEKFNPYEHGTRFSTYATFWIKQRLRRAVAEKSHIVRVPLYVQEIVSKVRAELYQRQLDGEVCSYDDVYRLVHDYNKEYRRKQRERITKKNGKVWGGECSVNQSVLRAITQLVMQDRKTVYLNTLVQDAEEASELHELLASEGEESIQLAQESEDARRLGEELRGLTKRQKAVLEMRYGMNGCQSPMTLQQVGNKYGLTRERVRQIECAALKTLKKIMKPSRYNYLTS